MQSGMCGYRNRQFSSLGKSFGLGLLARRGYNEPWTIFNTIISCTLSSSFAWITILINWRIANISFTDRGCWCPSWKRPETEIHWTQPTCYGNLRFHKILNRHPIVISYTTLTTRSTRTVVFQETVPKDRLLVWNLKDGWKPLCDFLNLPIPNVPVPRVNETSDKNFFAFYFWERLSPWVIYIVMLLIYES